MYLFIEGQNGAVFKRSPQTKMNCLLKIKAKTSIYLLIYVLAKYNLFRRFFKKNHFAEKHVFVLIHHCCDINGHE